MAINQASNLVSVVKERRYLTLFSRQDNEKAQREKQNCLNVFSSNKISVNAVFRQRIRSCSTQKLQNKTASCAQLKLIFISLND